METTENQTHYNKHVSVPIAADKQKSEQSLKFFNFESKPLFTYDPYPIGLCKPCINEALYKELVDNFPKEELFLKREHYGAKYSLSESDHGEAYFDYIKNTPIYKDFYSEIKNPKFIQAVLKTLQEQNIFLDTRYRKTKDLDKFKKGYYFRKKWLDLLRKLNMAHHLNARFEFSMLPYDGGNIKPHTDSPQKIITLVVSVLEENEWPVQVEGGGTQVLKPKDVTLNYNNLNRWLEFDETEVVQTFDFTPNQCVIFVKTFNSLHAVPPIKGNGVKGFRKSLTINIENVQKYFGGASY